MAGRERIWRMSVLGLLLLAILGPWGFDRIMVPAQYPCTAPIIRLEGDFCGVPLSGSWMLWAIISEFIHRIVELITGTALPSDTVVISGLFLGALLIVLPLLSTLVLILAGNRRPWQCFNVVAWGLALGVGLLMGMTTYPKLYWELWGTWLYIGVAVSALIAEVLILLAAIRPSKVPSAPGG